MWAWRPSCSCYQDHLNELLFPYEIWLQSAQWFLGRRCLKSMDDRQTDRPTYPISSPVSLRLRWGNQRISGPVNAHLTPGSGIYFNAFIHIYSPGQGQTTPWGQMLNRKPLSLCPFVASSKTISLKYDFIHVHVYSTGARAENPLGTNFWCQ